METVDVLVRTITVTITMMDEALGVTLRLLEPFSLRVEPFSLRVEPFSLQSQKMVRDVNSK